MAKKPTTKSAPGKAKPAKAKPKTAKPAIKICTEINVANDKALIAAIKERPGNAMGLLKHAPMGFASPAPAMAMVISKLWKNGRTLKISFIGAIDPVVLAKIKKYATEWLTFANLKFAFVAKGGDIRVSCKPGGSWSNIGTDALTVGKSKATMNYGWFTPETPDDEFSRVILHEFGHALGAIHEHQHPGAGIPWDKPAVYAYYAQQNWDQATVDHNIFRKYESNQLNMTSYDAGSIMHYAVPDELTLGTFVVGWNRRLSVGDKTLAQRAYPKPA